MVDLREKLGAKDVDIWFIIEDSCSSLRPSLWSSVETFRAGFNKSVKQRFRAGSIDYQLHAEPAIDGITHHVWKGAALHDGANSTNDEEVFDPPVDPEVIKL